MTTSTTLVNTPTRRRLRAMPAFLSPPIAMPHTRVFPLQLILPHRFVRGPLARRRRRRLASAPPAPSARSHRPSSPSHPPSSSSHPTSPDPQSSRPTYSHSASWSELSKRAHAVIEHLPRHDPRATDDRLRRAIRADPANPFLWHALARHLAASGDSFEQPIALLKDAVRKVPVGFRGGLFDAWGALELRRGRLDVALAIFADGLRTDPFAPLYLSLAVAQHDFHMLDDARETFRQGALAFPTHAALFRAWAFLETKHGSPSVACERWRVAVAKDRTNSRAWSMLIQAEQRCGASVTATATFLQDALVNCPHDTEFRLHLARIEQRRKGPAAAKAILTPVEQQEDANVLRALGRIEFDMGQQDRGRFYFRRAVNAEAAGKDRKGKRRPTDRTVRSLHAWALMEAKLGNRKEARRILEEAKQICQTDSGIWRAIAEIESREANFPAAREAFQRATELDPEDPRLYVAWGRTESLAGNPKRAEMLIDRVARMNAAGRRQSAPLPHPDSSATRPSDNVNSTAQNSAAAFTGSRTGKDRRMFSAPAMEEGRNDALTPGVLAAALRERAILAIKDGRTEDSVLLLTRASEVEPNSEVVWRLLATQELRLNGIESARRIYEQSLKKVNTFTKHKILHWWGQDERSCGNISEARELFRKSTCANPDYMSSWMSWGLMEKAHGRTAEACTIFEHATRYAERNMVRAPFIFQAWGRVEELDRGRPDKAADVFQRGVKLAPRSGPLWCAWGLLEQRRGNFEKARELFLMSTTAEPKHGSGWQSWGRLEAQRCNFKKAGELFRSGNEHEPCNGSLLVSWALMEGRDLGNVAIGRDIFDQAVKSDPRHVPAWFEWGRLEMKAGNLNRARELLEKARALCEGSGVEDVEVLHCLGELEGEYCGNWEAAIKLWRRGAEVSPGHADAYCGWGRTEVKRDIASARKVFNEGLRHMQAVAGEETGGSGKILEAWAATEDEQGHTDKARELLRRATREDAKHVGGWLGLAEIETRRGLQQEARQVLREGMECVEGERVWEIYARLGRLEAKDGRMDEAREVFWRGLRAFPSVAQLWTSFADAETAAGCADQALQIRMRFEALFARREAFEPTAVY